ncbi:RNA polymerase sigma-70 factor, ECF subfamily [Lachnospiraceae bacterium]|nr:RNA polymerase sigma-70 factor, ECF subfamily [Lachnospiraceae bacterium]
MESVSIEKYIEEYGKDVYSFCMYLTKNRFDADDLYQQTFLVAYEKGSIDSDKNPKSYLITIAVNIWNNQIRKTMWRRKKADIIQYDEDALERIEDKDGSIEEELIDKEEKNRIRKIVDTLPDKMRIVILMFYMEDMSIEDIAAALKIPAGTVKSRLFKAKKILKEKMAYE